MKRDPLTRAPQPKGITLCPSWFFGGPHQWNSRDICTGCGVTRAEAKTLAKFRVQPRLQCEDLGHPKAPRWTSIPWPVPKDPPPAKPLRLVVTGNTTTRSPR